MDLAAAAIQQVPFFWTIKDCLFSSRGTIPCLCIPGHHTVPYTNTCHLRKGCHALGSPHQNEVQYEEKKRLNVVILALITINSFQEAQITNIGNSVCPSWRRASRWKEQWKVKNWFLSWCLPFLPLLSSPLLSPSHLLGNTARATAASPSWAGSWYQKKIYQEDPL